MSIKVLFASPAYEPAYVYGGPVHSFHSLGRELVQLGASVDVLTTAANGSSHLDVPLSTFVDRDGVRVMYFRAEFLNPFIYSSAQRRALFDMVGRYDLVHTQSLFTFNSLWAASFALRHKVPFLISPRGSLVKGLFRRRGAIRKRGWLTLFDRRFLERADAVHLTTEYERLAMRELGINPRREVVIPNGIVFPETAEEGGSLTTGFAPDWGLTDGERRILFLGRLNWEKGLDLLVPAFAKALAIFPSTRLFLAGPDPEGYLPRLLKMAAEAGVSGRVVPTGPLDGNEKWRLIKACDLLVLPSYSENFGLAALEGAAMGKPVVVTREVGVADAIAEAGAGLVTENSVDSISKAIVRVIGDREESARMGERGRRLVDGRYRWPAIASRMLRLYEELIGNRGAR